MIERFVKLIQLQTLIVPVITADSWDLPPDVKVRRQNHPACRRNEMGCTLMDNSHWKTPPIWTSKQLRGPVALTYFIS